MSQRELIQQKAHAFFEDLWKRGDFWELETSEFEQARFSRLMAVINDRRYRHALEIGCGGGTFTKLLAGITDEVLGLDISATAVARARAAVGVSACIDFEVGNILDFNLEARGPWDLLVLSETIYYLGWLYPLFDIAWLASKLLGATKPGGRLLLANTQCGIEEPLMLPHVIRTYRDLFLNVGYSLEAEDVFRGKKNGASLEVLISLFTKSVKAEP